MSFFATSNFSDDLSPASSENNGFKRSLDDPEAAAAAAAAKKVYRRSYKACINCRAKKIKCDLGDLSNPSDPPCARCRREGRKCEFSVSRRGGAGNVRVGRQKKSNKNGANGGGIGEVGGNGFDRHHGSLERHGSNMGDGARTGAALSAAAVLATSAPRHKHHRDSEDMSEYGYTRGGSENPNSAKDSSGSDNDPDEDNDIAGKELHNTSDALDILAQAARNYPKIESPMSPRVPQPESSLQEQVFHPRPTIADTEVIKDKKFLTEHEAILFINYFFEQLHPFYPFIPEEMHSSDALAQMPILLSVILTISSRYCKFAEKGTKYFISSSRGAQIHSSLWDYCQQLISQTVWAEASTRSIGTVYSFLLISEWNPRAIHWRFNDYANSPRPVADPHTGTGTNSTFTTEPEKQAKSTKKAPPVKPQAFYPQKLPGDNGFDASKRSDRMSWLLIGTAIRLAQDMGIMDTDSNVYTALHLSETVLALRLGRRPMISSSVDDEFLNLEFTPFQQAKLAILKIMSLAHETLYLSRKNTRELLQGGRFLAFLNLFGPHLNNWENVYRPLFDEPGLERESILFDFHYTRLYIYSLALSNKSAAMPDISSGRPSGMLSDVLTATRYVGIATDAAREMLAIVSRVYEMDKLRLAPIRWIVRAVHAAVFLVKTVLLTPPTSMYLHKATISIIKKTAITLKDSSPDDVHLANRYSMILLNLCDDMTEKYHSAEHSQRKPKGNSGTLSKPTVAAVASALNVTSESTSMTDQVVPVLSVEGIVHPPAAPAADAQLQQEYYMNSNVGNNQETSNLLNNRPFLNEPSFGYSRYNGASSYDSEIDVMHQSEPHHQQSVQQQQQQQQQPQQQQQQSHESMSSRLFLPLENENQDTGLGMPGNSLASSYMHFGLGPVAGAATTEGNANTATSLTGTGLPDFNFDFWMDGNEGLGFVDQLVYSMEQQQHIQKQRERQQQQQEKREQQHQDPSKPQTQLKHESQRR